MTTEIGAIWVENNIRLVLTSPDQVVACKFCGKDYDNIKNKMFRCTKYRYCYCDNSACMQEMMKQHSAGDKDCLHPQVIGYVKDFKK